VTDVTLSEAIQEAYASAPADEVIYHTIELLHDGFESPVRLVRGWQDVNCTLEATAPANPLTEVTFVGMPFDFVKPEVTANGVPSITIEIDAVTRDLLGALDGVVASGTPLEVIYREFLESDTSAPQNDPPMKLTIIDISATPLRISATATFADLPNRRFPNVLYDSETFPGLVAQS
jgi:hypothetical protein